MGGQLPDEHNSFGFDSSYLSAELVTEVRSKIASFEMLLFSLCTSSCKSTLCDRNRDNRNKAINIIKLARVKYSFYCLCRKNLPMCSVHSPTNALFYLKKHIKIYIKIRVNIAPTCFGLRSSSGSLH